MKTDHLFEIPWNGDKNLIYKLANCENKDKVKFIYMPCIAYDGTNSRLYQADIIFKKDEFENVVNTMFDHKFKPCVLLQRNIKKESLSYYYDLGIRNFTVGEDDIAEYLREKYGNDVYLTASITKDLIDEDYEWYSVNKSDLYDIFVLRFNYYRDFENLKNLPKNLKYSCMPNSICLWDCKFYRDHWFPTLNEHNKYNSSMNKLICLTERKVSDKTVNEVIMSSNGEKCDLDKIIYILSKDLWFFDPYVHDYKLVDRMMETDLIIDNFMEYSNADITIKDSHEYDICYNRYNIAHNKDTRCYNPVY